MAGNLNGERRYGDVGEGWGRVADSEEDRLVAAAVLDVAREAFEELGVLAPVHGPQRRGGHLERPPATTMARQYQRHGALEMTKLNFLLLPSRPD